MQPAEAQRNQRAAVEAGDLAAADLWAADEHGMHDSHDATGGYCDYDGGDDGGYEDWAGCPDSNGNDAAGTAGGSFGFSAGADVSGDKPTLGMLSPLAQNLAPVVARGGAKVRASTVFIVDVPCLVATVYLC